MPAPTPQQLSAITTRGSSIVLSSGAGCGKTFVLTNRYLSHLKLDGVRVGEIVAITFTDRAAREMRGRIRAAVTTQMRENPDDPAWADHLRDLESAPIQTIHSFCGDLLRQFAVHAGLDPRFEVLEEILAENLRVGAIQETLQTLLTAETPAGRDLCELVILYGWTATVESIQKLLHERDASEWSQWLRRDPRSIAAQWSGPDRTELLPVWVEYLCAGAPKIARLLQLFRSLDCRGPLMKSNVQLILDRLPQLDRATDLAGAVDELCEAAKVGTEKGKAWPTPTIYEMVKDAMADFRADLPNKLELFLDKPADVEQAAIVGQRFLRVALTASEEYQQRKARAGVVDFQDLLVLARDLLRDRPEVTEALQQRYRFLLLDEMQDTDPVQMELVQSLCGIGIEHDKLFAVGDAKQSIYRFRGADVTLFERLRAAVPPVGRMQLTRNYRSHPGILHFVNALCSHRFADYEPLEAFHAATYSGSCVEFLWSVPASDAVRESVADQRAREADSLARRIAALIRDPEPRIRDGESLRRVLPGDIVLLFRSMSHVAIYEAALRRHELNYYLVGGRAFFAQQEVYDLLNLLSCLENPDDSIALAGTLRSPFGCLSDDALILLAVPRTGLWAALHDPECIASLPADQRPRAERIRRHLDTWRSLKDRLPVARLIGRVVADTGYDAALQFEFLGDRKLANLWKLIDLARAFDRPGQFGLAEFIARLGDLVSTQPREEQAATQPENADVIKVMSIHQSKGLEFPVVFVPDLAAVSHGSRHAHARWDRELGCIARPPSEDPPLFTDFPYLLARAKETVADWREDLRILYVACTRARDLLVLSAGLPERFPVDLDPAFPVPMKPANSWTLALGERFHLLTGATLDTSIAKDQRPKILVSIVEPATGPPAHTISRTETPPPAKTIVSIDPIEAPPYPSTVYLAELTGQPAIVGTASPFRLALGRWDLAGPLPELSDVAARDMLVRFAGSEWPARLRSAGPIYRDLAFLTGWPGSAHADDRPVIRGTFDFLWRENDGWHLLVLFAGNWSNSIRAVVERWVAERHFNEAVQGIALFNLDSGETTHMPMSPVVDPGAIRAELDELLNHQNTGKDERTSEAA